jgi:hypothetical protein
MTSISAAFEKAGFRIDGQFARTIAAMQRQEGTKIEPVETHITWLPVDQRYVLACPIPEGYLEQQARLNTMLRQRQTSKIMPATAKAMAEQGYQSVEEFAAAQMRAHLQETAYVTEKVAHTEETETGAVPVGQVPMGEGRVLPSFVREQPLEPGRSHVFHPSQMDGDPSSLIDEAEFDRSITATMKALVSTSDWDPALEYAQLKEWDGLCFMYERLRTNVIDRAKLVKDELARLTRETDDETEIPLLQVERLQRQLSGLRVQVYNFSRKFKAAKAAREAAVNASGIDFGPYISIADRAKRSAQAWASRKTARQMQLDRLIGLTPEELAKANLDRLRRFDETPAEYRVRLNGVDANDGANHGAAKGTSID